MKVGNLNNHSSPLFDRGIKYVLFVWLIFEFHEGLNVSRELFVAFNHQHNSQLRVTHLHTDLLGHWGSLLIVNNLPQFVLHPFSFSSVT